MQAHGVNVLKAWAVYYPLKCAVVILAMFIGERLGLLVVSIEKGPAVQEGVEMAWAALAVYYTTVAVVAVFLFKWTVSKFVVSHMVQDGTRNLSLFLYCKAWVVYAALTLTIGYLIAWVLDYAICELMLGNLPKAAWSGWLRRAVRPIAFTTVSLLVFGWAVIKLLLAEGTAMASSKTQAVE